MLGDEDHIPPTSLSSCEVGIRPSFYWVDAQQATQEHREEAEASFRFMKADCQDEAVVIHTFAGISGLTFVGVFDGHGPNGRAAAKFASSRLPELLATQISSLKSRSDRKRLNAMKEACLQVHEAMKTHKKCGFDASLSGTTACFAMISGSTVLLANVGDSRCVAARQVSDISTHSSSHLFRVGSGGNNTTKSSDSAANPVLKAIPLTQDAKPNLPEERARIIASGGVVQQLLDESGHRCGPHRVFRSGDNVLPGLAMSRSLGDVYAHGVGVTWMPALTSYTLTPKDLFLVLATDGLWDIMDSAATVDFIHRYSLRRDDGVSCAEALTLEAQERWKASHNEALVDDISVAILHTAPLPPPERAASLPRALTRAASCNDEANLIWSAWKEGDGGEVDPSIHAPQKYFEHLYRDRSSLLPGSSSSMSRRGNVSLDGSLQLEVMAEREDKQQQCFMGDEPTGQGNDRKESVNAVVMENVGKSGAVRRTSDDDCGGMQSTATPAQEHRSDPSSPMPRQGHHRSEREASPSLGPDDHSDESVVIATAAMIAASSSSTLVADAARSPFLAQQQVASLALCSTDNAAPAPTTSSGPSADSLAPLGRRSSSKPIPVGKQAHAPAHLDNIEGEMRRGEDGLMPLPGFEPSTNQHEFPSIRKAYPSTATITSIPSWDGGFHQSFKSENSLHGLNGGVDTPRSSESNLSATTPEHRHHRSSHHHHHGNANNPFHQSHGINTRPPHRGELHHEGKVHRGIPRSLSSAGLLSHGRISTDSESYTAASSRVGSLEESILAMSPRRGPLRTSSDVQGRIMSVSVNSRSSSYNGLVLGHSSSAFNMHSLHSSSFESKSAPGTAGGLAESASNSVDDGLTTSASQRGQPSPVRVASGRSVVLVRDVHSAAITPPAYA